MATDARASGRRGWGVHAVAVVTCAATVLFTPAGGSDVRPSRGIDASSDRPTEPPAATTAPARSAATPGLVADHTGPGNASRRVSPDAESELVTTRVPEELRPVAPDVIVTTVGPTPREPIAAHAHVPADLEDGAPAADPSALSAVPPDDEQAAEPGAWYWFGPRGLEPL